jgi:hypothetical protein
MGANINFWQQLRRGDPLKKFCNHFAFNRVYNVLEDIQGVNCRVVKPLNNEGRGWRIVVDGTSDVQTPDDFPRPYNSLEAFPYGSKRWLWGVDVADDVVTVGAGALRRAGQIYTCAAADVTITADAQYIAWKMTYSSGTDTWALTVDTTPTLTMPADADNIMRGPLYKVTFADDVVTGVVPWQHGIVVSNLWGA